MSFEKNVYFLQMCFKHHMNSCASQQLWGVVGNSADNTVFSGSERQNISIPGSLCSWPPPRTRLRSYYMTLLWTAEIYFKMLPVGSMSKALLYSLRMTAANWYLDLPPAVWSSLAFLCERVTLGTHVPFWP